MIEFLAISKDIGVLENKTFLKNRVYVYFFNFKFLIAVFN